MWNLKNINHSECHGTAELASILDTVSQDLGDSDRSLYLYLKFSGSKKVSDVSKDTALLCICILS